MAINVKSETGRLKKVLLHRPGMELEHLTPDTLARLLFDDIPYLEAARREHDAFASILKENGAEVVYLEELAAEALRSGSWLRERFVDEFIAEGGPVARENAAELKRLLMDIEDENELVLRTMAGVRMREVSREAKDSLRSLVRREEYFALDPIPNLYFTRDTFASLGNGVCLNRMYSATRRRESIYSRYIFSSHPQFAGKVKLYYSPDYPYSIEGGDILNLSGGTIAVGISQRTSPEGVELLAGNLFADPECEVRRVLAMEIPNIRAFMHLDTVLTQVDRDKFTVHPGILDALSIYELTPGKGGRMRAEELDGSLSDILRDRLELDSINLIQCGGKDPVAAEREQWNDASNTLCISPGVVITYDRNSVTNRSLRDAGVKVLEIASSELSRGRGGPRCMTMPLVRE